MRDFIQIDKESGNEIKGPPALAAKFGFVFETDLKQKIYGDNFCFEKIIRNGIYLLLTGRVTYLMERITALQPMIDKKKACFRLFSRFCPLFTREKFCPQCL